MTFTPAFIDNFVLLALLLVVAVAVVGSRNLLTSAILLGVFSFIMAAMYLVLDAPDVSITEAAVGAGVSTILILGCIALVGREEKKALRIQLTPLVVIFLTGFGLFYATMDMPAFGSTHTATQDVLPPFYFESTVRDIGIPNVVTAVLASYRGYDTMGETTVVLTAALAVFVLLGNLKSKEKGHES